MNAEYRNSTHRAALERQAHAIRTVGSYGWFSAGRFAAEERLRTQWPRASRHACWHCMGRTPPDGYRS